MVQAQGEGLRYFALLPGIRSEAEGGWRRGRAVVRLGLVLLTFIWPALTPAQQSASYRLEEHAFNAGGHPWNGTVITSAGFQLTLGAIGQGVTLARSSSASFIMDPGFVGTYPPPGEVTNVRFNDATTLVWKAERSAGVYNLYGGSVTDPFDPGYGTCQASGITRGKADVSDTPLPGEVLFILVTAENRLGEEGTKGPDGTGTQRDNSNPCP